MIDQPTKNETSIAPNNLRELLEQRVGANPEKVFLFSEADGREFTYSEFDLAVNRAAAMLVAQGIGKGDVVSLLMPNSVEYIIAYFACWKLGALAGPVNSLLKENEITFVLNNSETTGRWRNWLKKAGSTNFTDKELSVLSMPYRKNFLFCYRLKFFGYLED